MYTFLLATFMCLMMRAPFTKPMLSIRWFVWYALCCCECDNSLFQLLNNKIERYDLNGMTKISIIFYWNLLLNIHLSIILYCTSHTFHLIQADSSNSFTNNSNWKGLSDMTKHELKEKKQHFVDVMISLATIQMRIFWLRPWYVQSATKIKNKGYGVGSLPLKW